MKRTVHNACKPFFAFLLILLTACTTERSPVTGEKSNYAFSWEQEKELGANSDLEISQQMGLYDDEQLQRYVRDVGERIFASSDFADEDLPERYRNTEFTFRVIDSSVVNAFALPGGYVYVTRGLLAHLNNEAQLAMVLGHEIGHVAGRHSARQALKSQWSQIGLMAGILIGSEVLGDDHVQDIYGVGGTLMQLLLNKYSRDQEREADQLGVEYAAKGGYQAAEGAAFFRSLDRIAQESGSRIPSWQSTHPDPAEREEQIVRMARELSSQYRMNELRTDQYMSALNDLVVGEDPREGFVDDGTFVHPDLRFKLTPPRNWAVQNETQAVLMVDPKRQALIVLEIAAADSPKAAAEELVSGRQNTGIQVIGHSATRINGLDGYTVEAQARTQNGTVRLLDTFIEYNGNVYSIMGYSSAQQYSYFRNQFLDTMESFSPMRDSEYRGVEPVRLHVFKAGRSGTMDSFIPENLPGELSREDVAILNQRHLNDRINPDDWIKIPHD